MRISGLAERAGLPVATVKFYLREGLLPAGVRTSSTQATYDDSHVRRLRLIGALTGVGGLSLSATRQVLAALDDGPGGLHDALGAVSCAISTAGAELPEPPEPGGPGARLIAQRGWLVDACAPARKDLEDALLAANEAGIDATPELLGAYADAAEKVAAADIASVPLDSVEGAMTHVVFGTILFDRVLSAMRLLAQEDASARALGIRPDER